MILLHAQQNAMRSRMRQDHPKPPKCTKCTKMHPKTISPVFSGGYGGYCVPIQGTSMERTVEWYFQKQ